MMSLMRVLEYKVRVFLRLHVRVYPELKFLPFNKAMQSPLVVPLSVVRGIHHISLELSLKLDDFLKVIHHLLRLGRCLLHTLLRFLPLENILVWTELIGGNIGALFEAARNNFLLDQGHTGANIEEILNLPEDHD
jgi:hypothetical protein